MNVIVIASLIIAGTVMLGALLAVLFRGFNRAVVNEQQAAEVEKAGYNQALTYGYMIPVEADAQTQMKAARKEAARRAALVPRGANVGIGQTNDGAVQTAYQGVKDDPVTAVKIASIHTWEGLRSGSSFTPGQTLTHADAVTVPPTKSAKDLVPGEDYEVIEITEDMMPAEKRKARIANAKAKSAAVKALKAAGAVAPAAATTPEAPATAATSATAAATAAADPAVAKEPVPGIDYEVIPITDEMSPDEVRQARIANVKAKSAAMKAFKASGASAATTPVQPVEPSPAPEPAAAPTAAPTDITPPELIEITDDMAPDEVRKARIQNAKAKSAYKKALKETGIDPSTIA
ncbi:MAG: hypothetical protein JSW55_15480 [Chloroflexota bacterium]|nr:MAG: hypothetical protein JSW55_15480 [Chloroflexota bacterium]